MTGSSNPAGEQVEGNITEIDLAAHFFILEDRQAKPFIKVFWTTTLEGPADNPSYVFKKIRKLQPGFFAAPLVTLEENTGGLQEGILIDLPWKDRPADFPKVQKKGKGGGYGGQPRNERMIVVECMLKAYIDLWQSTHAPDTVDFADARIEILDAIEADLPRVLKAGGA